MDVIEWARKRLGDLKVEEQQLIEFLQVADQIRKLQATEEAHKDEIRSKQQEIEFAVMEILREGNLALSTQDLLDRLENEGHELGGKDPRNTLSAHLSNSKVLEYNKEHRGWWIVGAEEPMPF